MTTRYLNIEARERRNPFYLASLEDFTVSEGGEVDVEIILSNLYLSLYCLDDETQRAIFVELPPDVNILTHHPLMYSTQYRKAQRLIAVPYESFCKIAKTLPPVKHLIFIYMTGRSGSTLLSNVFNELDGPANAAISFVARHPAGGVIVLGTGKRERIEGAIKAVNTNLDRPDWYDVVSVTYPKLFF